MQGQCIEQEFLDAVDEINKERRLAVVHGIILDQFGTGHGETTDDFLNADPMMVLMEFMRLKNLRLIDLFQAMDKDNSMSLTRDEFKDGLQVQYRHLIPTPVDRTSASAWLYKYLWVTG